MKFLFLILAPLLIAGFTSKLQVLFILLQDDSIQVEMKNDKFGGESYVNETIFFYTIKIMNAFRVEWVKVND